jgi:hypothetical protein
MRMDFSFVSQRGSNSWGGGALVGLIFTARALPAPHDDPALSGQRH